MKNTVKLELLNVLKVVSNMSKYLLAGSSRFIEKLRELSNVSSVARLFLMCAEEGVNSEYISSEIREVDVSNDNTSISYYCYRDGEMKRIKMKAGKFVHKFFSNQYLDKLGIGDVDVEQFSNLWNASSEDGELTVIEGNALVLSYVDNNYYLERDRDGNILTKGTLWKSCMRHEKCLGYMSLYLDYPTEIKMLVLKKRGKVAGRALLWHLPNIKFMDRIYTFDDAQVEVFRNWAIKNNYFYKYKQIFNDDHLVDPQDSKNIIKPVLEFNLYKNKKYTHYPYLDTIKYLNLNTNTLVNTPYTQTELIPFMQNVDGILNYVAYCVWNKEYYKYVDCVKLFNGGYIYKKHACCVVKNNQKLYATPDDIVLTNRGNALKEDAVFGGLENCYLLRSESVYSDFYKTYILKENAIHINGDIVDMNHVFFSKTHKKYIHKEDAVYAYLSNGSGDWFHKDECFKQGDFYFLKHEIGKVEDKYEQLKMQGFSLKLNYEKDFGKIDNCFKEEEALYDIGRSSNEPKKSLSKSLYVPPPMPGEIIDDGIDDMVEEE